MRIGITKADKDTIDFVVDYSLKCDGLSPTSRNFMSRKKCYLKRLKRPGYKCFIASIDSIPVGYIDIELRNYEFEPALWINEIYVRKNLRGKNIARKLVGHICDISKKAGIENILADTEPDNIGSLKTLQKAGFKIIRHIFKKRL